MNNHSVSYLGPAEIRQLAQQLDKTPTKKWGQNFLHDPNTIRRIVAAAELDPCMHVLEVGPGLGSLTLGLLDAVEHVTAVEIDPVLQQQLPATAAQFAPAQADHLTVIGCDALQLTPQDLAAAGIHRSPDALVANLPYNVAVPVILHLLATFPSISRVLVMVQKEVADRLAASPGSKIYGVPSVKASFYGKVTRAGVIGRSVFWPEPNVDSALVRIDCFEPAAQPWPIDEAHRSAVFPLVDAAFAQRRKMLRAALKPMFGSADAAAAVLERAGVDPASRGEDIPVEGFVAIAAAMADHKPANNS
ncbi:Ribosomal RNA small subunit methyltransferase A [Corynebacterium choanae]|uniref:Ribosomal RNA small subunit methyltransferase A n=1 Tax=Corynebacterium choanae TaxID=1862358 RepID=A0A3G6J517_9CORY|nr:16S rRNA (adenine(1518)-N(6)/adenine(1519)-N(6))-dimethyltransferase RsmA [Corynebacterium choanae]AZA13127.1 Ribosomal RNA small subunit methyltransferase A [Corynebacterium choanae]